MQHDIDVTALGFAHGVIPYQETSVYAADPDLVNLAYEASTSLLEGKSKQGRVLSGDQFIASRDKVAWLHETLAGTCTEMEGASVAQVCAMNELPYVVIRSMSDKADGSAHVNFEQFTQLAADRSFAIVQRMLESYQANK
jgi:adenosylhomocysteine nucleosidase